MEAISHHPHVSTREVAGVSFTEGVGGAGAAVLAILALIHVLPMILAPIAAMALGVAMAIGGGSIAAQYGGLLARTEGIETAELVGGGMASESLLGIAGALLGLLALLDLAPSALLPVSVLVLGAALLLAGSASSKLNSLIHRLRQMGNTSHEAAAEAAYAASGLEVLAGLGAITLGILALTGLNPMVLTYVGLLTLAGAVIAGGAPITARLLNIFAP